MDYYLNYKSFSLSFSFYGSFGNKIYNKQRRDLLQNSSSNMTPLARDCYRLWKYQGQITEVYSSAKATTGVNNARELSSFFLEDGDYIRLTNARLAYRDLTANSLNDSIFQTFNCMYMETIF